MRIPAFSQMAIAFEKLAGPTHSPLWRGDEAHTSNVVGGVCGGSSGGGVVVVVVVFAATATCSACVGKCIPGFPAEGSRPSVLQVFRLKPKK